MIVMDNIRPAADQRQACLTTFRPEIADEFESGLAGIVNSWH